MALVDGLDLNRCPEHRKGRCYFDRGLKVVARPLKAFVGKDIHLDEEIPVRGTVVTGFTIALHAQAHPAVHIGRDMDRDLPLYPGVPGTVAAAALLLRDFAPAATHRTGRHADELAEDRLRCLAHLPAAATAGTDIGLFCLATRSRTCGTGLTVQDFDLLVCPCHCFFKRELHAH